MADETMKMIYDSGVSWRGEWIKLLRWIRTLPEKTA